MHTVVTDPQNDNRGSSATQPLVDMALERFYAAFAADDATSAAQVLSAAIEAARTEALLMANVALRRHDSRIINELARVRSLLEAARELGYKELEAGDPSTAPLDSIDVAREMVQRVIELIDPLEIRENEGG